MFNAVAALALGTALAVAVATAVIPSGAAAGPVRFTSEWKEQRFSLFSGNRYSYGGKSLGVRSADSVSLTYVRLPVSEWQTRQASWEWSVARSVPPTDLARKGGDDRNLALYFVFLPLAEAQRLAGKGSIRSVLKNESARVLVYTWGGEGGGGRIIDSPYLGPRGKTVLRRAAGTGSFAESVDLTRDYRRAFGKAPEALVGLAVSADSDDTDSAVEATLSALTLK